MSVLSRALLLAWLLTGCSAPPDGPSAEQQAQDQQDLAKYQQLRADGQFELAEQQAERLLKRHGKTTAANALRETLTDTHERAATQREQRRLEALWDYQRVAVAGGEQRTAALYSLVDGDPEAEVAAIPDARLVLRRHPDWGRSAYLLLNQSSLHCGPPCEIVLRFDGGEAQRYHGKPADSGSGPALFIVEEARFLDALQKARRLRIELPRSGVLAPAFEFEVAGFLPAHLTGEAR